MDGIELQFMKQRLEEAERVNQMQKSYITNLLLDIKVMLEEDDVDRVRELLEELTN